MFKECWRGFLRSAGWSVLKWRRGSLRSIKRSVWVVSVQIVAKGVFKVFLEGVFEEC